MNTIDRQLKLDTTMYRNKTFGKEPYCARCWAKCNGCICPPAFRSMNQTCVKAECRMLGIPFKMRNIIEPKSNKYRNYGLKKGDV